MNQERLLKVIIAPVISEKATLVGETRKQIVFYMVALLLGSLTLVAIGTLGWFYLAVALLSGGALLYYAIRLMRSRSLADARAFFWFSNYYLALLFAAMVIDHLWH